MSMAPLSTETSGESTTINNINSAICYTMAKRSGILASRYAFIDQPQNPYAANELRHSRNLDSHPTPEPTSASLMQIDDIDTHIPDLPHSFIRKGINASRYAPNNFNKPGDAILNPHLTLEPAHALNQSNAIDSQRIHLPNAPRSFKRSERKDINASRYAPQNYNKPENIAFRQSSCHYQNSKTPSLASSYDPETTVPNTRRAPVFMQQANGHLPYKVQHRVLTAIQILLEESCYDYAVQWLPRILEERNWTCSEAVEMAKWKEVLSGPLPEGSITTSGRYSINRKLSEAVRIRNITAHRESCDNNSIQKMISSAQKLVEILKDEDRVNRLGRLRDEIYDWVRSEEQHQAASMNVAMNEMDQDPRMKLHNALQEITEHPFAFDEMDWALDQDTPEEKQASVEEFGDEMEWE